MKTVQTTTSAFEAIEAALSPRHIAVVGASEDVGKFGGRIMRYLLHHRFAGELYPVNAKRNQVSGVRAYPSLDDLPETPDLVVICVPQPFVRDVVETAGRQGSRAAVVVSNGFADAGDEGRAHEEALVETARANGIRLIGPNCMGFISAATGTIVCSSNILNIERVPAGGVGFASQSGAVLMAFMDCAFRCGVGFSHSVTLGNQADLELCDFVEYLLADDNTRVICTYVEGLKDPDRFVALARRARDVGKPWLMLKSGRTPSGAEAAFSHTASLVGSYRAFETVCRENGIVLMKDAEALLVLAGLLERYPTKPVGRVALSSSSGGSLALAADRLFEEGLSIAELVPESRKRLAEYYPPQITNPVDVGVATRDALGRVSTPTAEILLSDPNTDIFIAVISTAPDLRAMTQYFVEGAAAAGDKPFAVVLEPAALADSTRESMVAQRIPYADNFDAMARALGAWHRTTSSISRDLASKPPVDWPAVKSLAAGELGEFEAKALLASVGVETNRGGVVSDIADTESLCADLSWPVVVKVVSPDIVHKSDVGGVVLNLDSPAAVRAAIETMSDTLATTCPQAHIAGYLVQEQTIGDAELIVGIRQDEQFGPLISVGTGGVWVEILADVEVATAPVSAVDAKRMIRSLRTAPLLEGARGKPALDIAAAADVVSRVSWLAHDLGGRLAELDINPLLLREEGLGCTAVDARARLTDELNPPATPSAQAATA